MRGVIGSVKEMRELLEKQGKSADGGGAFLKLEDGQSATVRFLQELDDSGRHYDEESGVAISVFEHVNPDDFSKRFLCTNEEEGKCVGCERKVINRRWNRKARMYINAYVKEDNTVKILATNFTPKGFAGQLIEYFDDFGTITDRDYKLKRTGAKLQTSYTLIPREIAPFSENVELRDIENFIPYRSYEDCLQLVNGEVKKDDENEW